MQMNEIKLQQIIERKVKYIETSTIYEDLEFENVKKGELEAYKEIIYDIANMAEEAFIYKYFKKIENLKDSFDSISDKVEVEQLSGYNNAIIFVLSLLNPKYEFEID